MYLGLLSPVLCEVWVKQTRYITVSMAFLSKIQVKDLHDLQHSLVCKELKYKDHNGW